MWVLCSRLAVQHGFQHHHHNFGSINAFGRLTTSSQDGKSEGNQPERLELCCALKEGSKKKKTQIRDLTHMWHETHPSQEKIFSVMISTSSPRATSHRTACPAKSAPSTYVIACITVCMRAFVINGHVSCRLWFLVDLTRNFRGRTWVLSRSAASSQLLFANTVN